MRPRRAWRRAVLLAALAAGGSAVAQAQTRPYPVFEVTQRFTLGAFQQATASRLIHSVTELAWRPGWRSDYRVTYRRTRVDYRDARRYEQDLAVGSARRRVPIPGGLLSLRADLGYASSNSGFTLRNPVVYAGVGWTEPRGRLGSGVSGFFSSYSGGANSGGSVRLWSRLPGRVVLSAAGHVDRVALDGARASTMHSVTLAATWAPHRRVLLYAEATAGERRGFYDPDLGLVYTTNDALRDAQSVGAYLQVAPRVRLLLDLTRERYGSPSGAPYTAGYATAGATVSL